MNNDQARHIDQVHDALTSRGVPAARVANGKDHEALFQLRGDWSGYTLIWSKWSLDAEDLLNGNANTNGSWLVSMEEASPFSSPKKGFPLPVEDTPERTVDQITSCLNTLKRGGYIRIRH